MSILQEREEKENDNGREEREKEKTVKEAEIQHLRSQVNISMEAQRFFLWWLLCYLIYDNT